MTTTYKLKTETLHNPLVALLNQLLAGAVDLSLEAKQAHWNVRGENFIALHELFDKVSHEAREYADLLAERAVQIDGIALGTVQEVIRHSRLAAYPTEIRDSQDHVKELSAATGMLAESMRRAIKTAVDTGDAVTADLLTEITRGLDKQHWFLESHISYSA